MRSWRLGFMAAVCALLIAGMCSSAMAQAQGGGRGNRGNRGQNGNFDPAAMRQRMFDRIKEQLGATDDEWQVLQPKIQKVMDAQRDSRDSGRMGGRGGRGGRGGNNNPDQPQSEVAKASAALRAALEDKSTSAEELVNRMKALRSAREASRAKLVAAQKELKDVLTARQEAILLSNGTLD